MVPRFIRTFLLLSLLIILPTTYLIYNSHTEREVSLDAENLSKDGFETLIDREDHWDQGGAGPLPSTTNTGNERGMKGKKLSGNRQYGLQDQDSGLRDEVGERVLTSDKDLSGVQGGVIMSKLGNETIKAELGRAAWKVMHTMTLRFPEKPTADERSALKSYFHLFSRLYPCGECAQEFQSLLKDFPPQTSSRKSASLWLCSIHNMVNVRLGKEVFDCDTLEGFYDCGCGDEEGVTEDTPVEDAEDELKRDQQTMLSLEEEEDKDESGTGGHEEENVTGQRHEIASNGLHRLEFEGEGTDELSILDEIEEGETTVDRW